jgi:TIR domain
MAGETSERLVFISHAGEDTWIAQQIAREVASRGARPFLDQADIDVGAEFEEDILRFLDRTNELIVLFTPWSLERPYVWAEIGAAWIRRIPIVVVLLGISSAEFQSRPNTPVFLKKRDIIQLNQIDQYPDQLRERVAGERGNG